MCRLQLLGGFRLDLDGADAPLASVRPRILALLALLASHGSLGLSRDKLLAYLWPESDNSHARNSLKQALFSLRRVLGDQAVNSASGVLRLAATSVEVDAWQFEWALSRGDAADAVTLYQGPFLDGFYASRLHEFERWVDAERHRLGGRYVDALRGLARNAEARGDATGAVMWWRRLAEAEPLSSATAVALMRALIAAGDPAGAVQHAREHTKLVRRELELPVEEPVSAMVRSLQMAAVGTGAPMPMGEDRVWRSLEIAGWRGRYPAPHDRPVSAIPPSGPGWSTACDAPSRSR